MFLLALLHWKDSFSVSFFVYGKFFDRVEGKTRDMVCYYFCVSIVLIREKSFYHRLGIEKEKRLADNTGTAKVDGVFRGIPAKDSPDNCREVSKDRFDPF